MIVCGKVCFSVVLTSILLSCDRSQFSLPNKALGKSFMTSEFFSEELCLDTREEFRESLSQHQAPLAQNSQYTKVTYFEVAF